MDGLIGMNGIRVPEKDGDPSLDWCWERCGERDGHHILE